MGKVATERHLAAILIADIVGYSRLMGVDEDGTLRRLRALRSELIDRTVRQHEGHLVKSTGDGVLVEFPSAVRAVRCALDVQRSMIDRNADLPEPERLCLRIGINVGELTTEPDGDVYGDSVNLAARLEALSPCGGLCFSRAVRDQIRDRIALSFEDWGERPLKNIARPVRVFAVTPEVIATLPAMSQPEHARRSGGPIVVATVVLSAVGLLAGGVWSALRPAAPPVLQPSPAVEFTRNAAARAGGPAEPATPPVPGPGPPRLSVVVLPFANLSDEAGQDYLADSITADLTTDLSRVRESFVIASGTAMSYKGKAPDVRQVGRDLGVRYVLTGSVRRTGERIRVNSQLADATGGGQIWSDRFESDRGTFMEMQDELIARLARTLDLELTDAESRRTQRERSDDPDASDIAMRGWSVLNRPITQQQLAEAQDLFEQSLRLDPRQAHARLGLARTLATKVNVRWSTSQEADLTRAETLNDELLATHPADAMAHFVKADILRARKQFVSAITAYETSIALNPNFAPAYGAMASALLRAGRSADAIPQIDRAARLSPRDPLLGFWLFVKGHAYAHLKRDAEAVEWCQKSLAASATPYWLNFVDLASSNAWLGHVDEARSAVEALRRIKPGYTVGDWQREGWSDDPVFLREYQRIVEGLRKAGLPE